MTAAEEYAALRQAQFEQFLEKSFSSESLKGVDLYEVKVPTGKIFKCRKIGPDYVAFGGSMPMSLASHLATSDQGSTPEDKARMFNEMTPAEKVAAIQSSAQMVRYCAVEPRLIVGPLNGHRNAISVDMLTMDDFNHLAQWASTGGDSSPGLKTFRRKRT